MTMLYEIFLGMLVMAALFFLVFGIVAVRSMCVSRKRSRLHWNQPAGTASADPGVESVDRN